MTLAMRAKLPPTGSIRTGFETRCRPPSMQVVAGIQSVERRERLLGIEQLRLEAHLLRMIEPGNLDRDVARMRLRDHLPGRTQHGWIHLVEALAQEPQRH